jgi:alanine dehydrogenase
MLIIDNETVSQLLTMDDCVRVQEEAFRKLPTGGAIHRPRIDMYFPCEREDGYFRWGTMEGANDGYFAIRMKSDIMTWPKDENGNWTEEKYCREPGTFCGMIFLLSTRNGEPLAFINDGVLQHMRVGGGAGIGAKYLAREDTHTVGMLGSGGMARTHMEAFMCVRDLKRLQVYSPTPANREAFAAEMRETYGIEVVVCDKPRDIYRGANIVAALTDSAVPVLDAEWIEPGTHVVNVGGRHPDAKTLAKVDMYLRFGSAPAPWGQPDMALEDEYITYAAQPRSRPNVTLKRTGERGHGAVLPDRMITFKDIVEGTNRGRSAATQITYSERGNLQGAQFWAVGGLVYEKAKAAGLGNEIPTEWLLQDIRD